MFLVKRQGGGGGYRCVCPKGYVFDSRTKGCEGKMLACFWSSAREGGGSYRCVCPKGYVFAGS